MRECDYCGKFKKVAKRGISCIPCSLSIHGLTFNYICEECNNAKKIEWEKINKVEIEKKKKEQSDWIKERDKLLKEHQNSRGKRR